MNFSKSTLSILQKQIIEALEDISTKNNIKFSFSGGNFSELEATLKLKICTENENGEIIPKERIDYLTNANLLNLKPEWLDKTFISRNKIFKIIGLKLSHTKYPVICQNVETGKRFKFPSYEVREGMTNPNNASRLSIH